MPKVGRASHAPSPRAGLRAIVRPGAGHVMAGRGRMPGCPGVFCLEALQGDQFGGVSS